MSVQLRFQPAIDLGSRIPIPLTPEYLRRIVRDHGVLRISVHQLPQQGIGILRPPLIRVEAGPADLHGRMPYVQPVRLLQASLRLLIVLLLQRAPAPVIILEEEIVICIRRPLKLSEFHILSPLAFTHDIIDKMSRKLLPQRLGALDYGEFPVQQLPDLRGQPEMFHQKAQQLKPAVLLLFQR